VRHEFVPRGDEVSDTSALALAGVHSLHRPGPRTPPPSRGESTSGPSPVEKPTPILLRHLSVRRSSPQPLAFKLSVDHCRGYGGDVFELGSALARAREKRGLELADVERSTHIRGRYLLALEAEQFDQLPGRAYARVFLRSYASFLELDADQFAAEFDERVPDEEAEEGESGEEPLFESGRAWPPRLTLAVVTIAAAAGVVAVVLLVAGTGHPSHRGLSGRPASQPRSSAQPSRKRGVASRRSRSAQAQRPPDLVVRAVGPCWVLARGGGPTGPILLERTLRRGERVAFARRRVWLRLGAPGNVIVRRGTRLLRWQQHQPPVNVIA
jgi:hypothetical protein